MFGNILIVDLRFLISMNNLFFFKCLCMYFISVIFNECGVEYGCDFFLVFYVNFYFIFVYIVVKFVVIRFYWMWVVEIVLFFFSVFVILLF